MKILARFRNAGFTLVEIILALGISIVAAAAIFSLFLSQSRSMRQSQDSMEVQDNVRVALDMIGRDLRSAGFLLNDSLAFVVENNCGSSATGGAAYPGVGLSGNNLVYGTTTSIDATGDVQGTSQEDGCPNGSDRLTVFGRPRSNYVQNVATNNGCNGMIEWVCPNNDCTDVFTRAGITGATCGATTKSDPLKICNADDPYRCWDVKVQPQGGQCDCTGSANCVVQVEHADGSTFTCAAGWDQVCPTCAGTPEKKASSAFNSIAMRTYQLLDVDADGSTELVVSQNQMPTLVRPGTVITGQYDVVANYIDDLQIGVAFRNTPETYENLNVWNFSSACTQDANNACLTARTAGASANPPVALRVSLIARSSKRRVAANGAVDPTRRNQLHDNNPAFTPYNIGAIPTAGAALCYTGQPCGCGSGATADLYLKCTQNGNAQGYARRVVTEVISLRNLQF